MLNTYSATAYALAMLSVPVLNVQAKRETMDGTPLIRVMGIFASDDSDWDFFVWVETDADGAPYLYGE